jgi:aromatic ring-opening dioxygenase LigB subunit
VVFIASGDLSHKESADGPYGYAEEGVLFDSQITEAMASGIS